MMQRAMAQEKETVTYEKNAKYIFVLKGMSLDKVERCHPRTGLRPEIFLPVY